MEVCIYGNPSFQHSMVSGITIDSSNHRRSVCSHSLNWVYILMICQPDFHGIFFDTNKTMITNFMQYTGVYKFYYHEECLTSYPNTCMILVLFNSASNIGNIVYFVENIEMIKLDAIKLAPSYHEFALLLRCYLNTLS